MTTIEKPLYYGSSSNIPQFEPGMVLKVPREVPSSNAGHEILNRDRAKGFEVERQIYEALGAHNLILPFVPLLQSASPRLTDHRYYRCREFEGRQGLLLRG